MRRRSRRSVPATLFSPVPTVAAGGLGDTPVTLPTPAPTPTPTPERTGCIRLLGAPLDPGSTVEVAPGLDMDFDDRGIDADDLVPRAAGPTVDGVRDVARDG